MSEAASNPKKYHLREGDSFGFSDAGAPVPFENFDFEILDIEANQQIASRDWAAGFTACLNFINAGKDAPRRLKLTAFALGCSDSKSQLELAGTLGISPAAVSQQLNALKKDFAQMQRLFTDIRRRRAD